jgi:hypothetical protein
MRKLALGLATVAIATASPALAHNYGWYVQGAFGPLLAPDFDYDLNGTGTPTIHADADYGIDSAIVFGHDFGNFRLESEGSFKRFDLDALTSTVGVPGAIALLTGTRSPVGGNIDIYSAMVNGLLDFGDDDSAVGMSIGGGVGYATVVEDLAISASGPGFIHDRDAGFAC